MTPGTWSRWMKTLWKSAQTCASISRRTCWCHGSWMDTLGWLWKKSVLPPPARQKPWWNSGARAPIPFHRLYVESQRRPLTDIAWAWMTSDFTRKTSCASQVCVRTLLRATPLDVAMNLMRKASIATAAWPSSASTSKMLFQSKEPASTFLWISLMMRFRSLLCEAHVQAACCWPEAVGASWVLYILLVPYLLHPRQLFLYNICDGSKSLGTIAL